MMGEQNRKYLNLKSRLSAVLDVLVRSTECWYQTRERRMDAVLVGKFSDLRIEIPRSFSILSLRSFASDAKSIFQ